MKSKLSCFYLLVVAALWGLTFPIIETSMQTQDPFLFVSIRFTLASLPVLPYFIKNMNRNFIQMGVILGVIQCCVFIFQTIGLQTLNASRAAFLTGINVLLIPFLAPLFRMGSPTRHDIVSAIICCLGIFILTGCDLSQMTVGDFWIIACAIFIALSIIYIGMLSKQNLNPYMIAYGQIIFTALFSWIPSILLSDLNFSPFLSTQALISMGICSLFATIFAIFLQSKYQKDVSLQYTAIIFSFEPVFAAFFDTLLTDTKPKLFTLIGGAVILLSVLYLELWQTNEVEEANALDC